MSYTDFPKNQHQSNPRTYDLTPGLYEVRIRTLGAHSGQDETIEVEIKPQTTVKKILTY